MVGRLFFCFGGGGGGIRRTDNISFEWLSLCQGAEIFFRLFEMFGGVAIFSGEGCRDLPGSGLRNF